MASASGRLELPATSFMETFGFARPVGSSRVSSKAPARQGGRVLAAIGKRHNTLLSDAGAASPPRPPHPAAAGYCAAKLRGGLASPGEDAEATIVGASLKKPAISFMLCAASSARASLS